MPLNIRIQWNAGTTCVSECVLKTLACRGLRVGPSKLHTCSLTDLGVISRTCSRDERVSLARLITPMKKMMAELDKCFQK